MSDPRDILEKHFGFREFLEGQGRVVESILAGNDALTLIGFASMIAFALIVSIRRVISAPFSELLKATEKISNGDLSYRIRMDRSDEFGVVAARFDDMVSDLESSSTKLGRKLNETEFLFDIARMAAGTLDRKSALTSIVQLLAEKLNYGSCSFYALQSEQKAFNLEASNDPDHGIHEPHIASEQ